MSITPQMATVVSFNTIVDRCVVSRESEGESQDNIQLAWIAFENLADACFKKNQRLQVSSLFTLSKCPQTGAVDLEFLPRWLEANKLSQAKGSPKTIQPTVKMSVLALESFFPYKKCNLEAIMTSFATEIERCLLFDGQRVEIDLKGFGRVFKSGNSVSFARNNSSIKPFYQPFDVQTLQRFPQAKVNKTSTMKLPKIRAEDERVDRPIEVLVSQDNTNYEKKNPANIKIKTLKTLDKTTAPKGTENKLTGTKNAAFEAARQRHLETLRRFQSGTIDNFDFDKSQYFSQAFHSPNDIWNQQYLRPSELSDELPKVLESHSQTKAKPVALVFNSLSVSSRVAINYTPLSKYLYLDPRTKRITILNNNENDVYSIERLKRRAKGTDGTEDQLAEEQSADESFTEEKPDFYELQTLSHQRFYELADKLIREDEVIDFSPKLLESLWEHAAKCLKDPKAAQSSPLLKRVFSEIQNDFKKSLKRGILHYLLKNREERARLELPHLPERPQEYGQSLGNRSIVTGTRGKVAELNAFLSDNLLLFSPETNDILDSWSMFENECLFNFEVRETGIEIAEFIEQQRANIVRIRTLITSVWVKRISEIYKARTKTLKKRQLRVYFDTMGTVISGQVRQLIETSLARIREFFCKFESESPLAIEDAFDRFKSPKLPLEKFFLVINLRERNGVLAFENDIESVTEELIEVIKDAVKCSENVARPENFFHRLEKNNLDSVSLNETFVEETVATIRRIVTANFRAIEGFAFIFRDFYYLFEEKNALVAAIADGVDQESLLLLFKKYAALEDEIVERFPNEVPFKMVKISAAAIKEQLRAIPVDLRRTIEEHVYREIESAGTTIVKTLKNNFDGLTTRIDTVEKLIEKETWLNNFKTVEFPALQNSYQGIIRWYDRFSQHVRFSYDRIKHIYDAREQIIDYKGKIEKEEARIRAERETLEKRLVGRKGVVNSKAADLATRVEGYRKEGKAFWIEKMVADLAEAKGSLFAIQKDIELINREEELMGFPKSEFENVKQSATSILTFELFWQNLSEWTSEHDKWEKTVIFKLNKDRVAEKCTAIHKTLERLLKEMRSLGLAGPEPLSLGEKIVAAIESFQVDFEMVKYFCNPGLAPRHWTEINKHLSSNGIDVKLESGGTYYISTLKDLNLGALQAGIAEVSATATKEWENERFLASVEAEFDESIIELKEYKHTNEMYVLPGKFAENTILKLNNSLFRIELMSNSPYATVFMDKIADLTKSLVAARDAFQLWLKLQSQWTYLEPVFNTDDVVKSMPQESMKFKEAQVAFRGFVLARKRDPSFKELTFDAETAKKLMSMLEMLENVDKNLENYLDKKRSDFLRLNFMSSEALVDLIATAKSPLKLGKHVRGLFGGVGELKVNHNEEIEGIVSPEGEVLNFTQKISIRAFKGHVERWLSALEESINYEVKRNLITSLQDYLKLEREAFMVGRLAQIALNVTQTAWTYETESAIVASGHKALKEGLSEVDRSLTGLLPIASKFQSRTDRLTVELVIGRSLHNRDILQQLIKQKVQKITDYAWESQLRVYWEQNNIVENSTSKLQMMYASLYYGYEYVGIGSSFVTTPLTDRCFRTFFTASQSFNGVCLEGPSATGKTETVKEFAKTTGKFLLVLNGSSLMDGKSAVRVLKGIASSGCWACFDEFNLIAPNVLSVIAQQLQRIQSALSQGKQDFVFNGSLMKLRGNCTLFTTINSGFADTKELPENVKFLFRATAVVEPDSQLILETKLYCSGFQTATLVARRTLKAIDSFKSLLMPKSASHFTLRSTLSIANSAAKLKLEEPETDEFVLIGKAIETTFGPRFSDSEVKQLKEVCSVILGGNRESLEGTAKGQNGDFELAEQPVAEDSVRQFTFTEPSKQFVKHVLAIESQLKLSNAVILFGDSMTGKSKALEMVAQRSSNEEIVKVFPESMETSDFFGVYNKETLEWQQGVIQEAFNGLSEKTAHSKGCFLVFDGPLHSAWAEGLNTLFDDSRRLSLPNGDSHFLPSKVKVVIETSNIQSASPATVSRCGSVYFDSDSSVWKDLSKGWIRKFDFLTADDTDKVQVFFSSIYEPLLRAVRSLPKRLSLNDCQLFKSFAILAQDFLYRYKEEQLAETDSKEKIAFFDQVFIFALIWSFGSTVAESHLKAFDLAVKKATKTPDKSVSSDVWKQFRKVALPETGSVFDQRFVFNGVEKETGKLIVGWKQWSEGTEPKSLSSVSQTIGVQLNDQLRHFEIVKMLSKFSQNVILFGPVGSGKSTIMRLVRESIETETALVMTESWGLSSTSLTFCKRLNKQLTRRISDDCFFPNENKTEFIIVVEDINFGQRTAEFTRSILQTSSYADIEEHKKSVKPILKPQLFGTITQRSSSQPLCQRLSSDFLFHSLPEMDDESANKLISAIIVPHFDDSFSQAIVQKVPKFVSLLVDLTRECRRTFSSSLHRSQYVFSIRDALRAANGLLSANTAHQKSLEEIAKVIVHECFSSFANKLSDQSDELTFVSDVLKPAFANSLSTNIETAVNFNDSDDERRSKLTNFIKRLSFTTMSLGDFNPKGGYVDCSIPHKLVAALEASVQEKVKFVPKMTELVLKTSEIVCKRGLHAAVTDFNEPMLKSALKVSCELFRSDLINFGSPDWSVTSGTKRVIYVNEKELADHETIDTIASMIENQTPDIVFVFFFAPGSPTLKTLVQQRPSLVSRLQVICWPEWTADVLKSIASSHLSMTSESQSQQQKILNSLIEMHFETSCVYQSFTQRTGFKMPFGPTDFQRLIDNFNSCHSEQFGSLQSKINQLERGLSLIAESEEVILRQSERMEELKPSLEEANVNLAALVSVVQEKAAVASGQEKIVAAEELKVRAATDAAKLIAEECQYEVNLIQPEIDRAKAEISKITKQEIDELKQMKNPPLPVQFALQSLSLLMNTKPEMKRDPVSGKISPDWWATSRVTLGSLNLDFLVHFDQATQMDEPTYRRLESFFNDPKSKEYLEENSIKFSSPIACSLFIWVNGQTNLFGLNLQLQPKLKALEEANQNLTVLQSQLASKRGDFEVAREALAKLETEVTALKSQRQQTENEIAFLVKKTEFANKLLKELPDEKETWNNQLMSLRTKQQELIGDVLLTAGYMTYLGALDYQARLEAVRSWTAILRIQGLVSDSQTVSKGLSSVVPQSKLQKWIRDGLQSDPLSIDNAVLMSKSLSTICLIDSHSLSKKWLQVVFPDSVIVWTRMSDESLSNCLQSAMAAGSIAVIEDVVLPIGKQITGLLKSIGKGLAEDTFVEFMGAKVLVSATFRVVLVTRSTACCCELSETASVDFVNFEVTPEGLAQQLLSQIFTAERPTLEAQHQECLADHSNNAVKLEEIESRVLGVLSGDKMALLEDHSVLEVLAESRQTTALFKEKQTQLAETYNEVLQTRREYESFAAQTASLFIVAVNFNKVNKLYDFSLHNFTDCLSFALANKQSSRTVAQRIAFIDELFLQILCRNVCKGLFVQDKLLFVLVLALAKETVSLSESGDSKLLDFLFTASESLPRRSQEFSDSPWVSQQKWRNLMFLERCCLKLNGLCSQEETRLSVADLMRPERPDYTQLPPAFQTGLSPLETYCLLKAMHPERTWELTEKYVGSKFGADFLSLVTEEDFEGALSISSVSRPVLLVCQSGVDPYAHLCTKNTNRNLTVENVLVAKGQTESIERVIDETSKNGGWLLLQNFGPEETVWKAIASKFKAMNEVSRQFQLFVSCDKAENVPSHILRNSNHVAVQEPVGFKRALTNILEDELLNNQEFHDSCDQKRLLQQIAMPLCFIHATVQERSRLSEGGFSRSYRFNNSDFKVTLQQLQSLLSKLGDDFVIDIIKQFIVECNYGARMTTDSDRSLLAAIVDEFLNYDNLRSGKIKLSRGDSADSIVLSDLNNRSKALEFAKRLPDNKNNEILGFERTHFDSTSSSAVYFDVNLRRVFEVFKRQLGSQGLETETKLKQVLQGLPPLIDVSQITKKATGNTAFGLTFVVSEIEKLNSLVLRIKNDIESGVDELTATFVKEDRVPEQWTYWPFSCQLSLLDFLYSINESACYFEQVVLSGRLPKEIRLSAFSNPKALICALKAIYALESNSPIESIVKVTEIVHSNREVQLSNNAYLLTGSVLLNGYWDFEDQLLQIGHGSEGVQEVSVKLSFALGTHAVNEKEFQCPLSLKKGSETILKVRLPCSKQPSAYLKKGVKMVVFD